MTVDEAWWGLADLIIQAMGAGLIGAAAVLLVTIAWPLWRKKRHKKIA